MDENINLNLALWQMMLKLLCFKDIEKFNYFFYLYFFVFGLVCCFVGYCGVILVNWFQ
jgi:hypothetical protein